MLIKIQLLDISILPIIHIIIRQKLSSDSLFRGIAYFAHSKLRSGEECPEIVAPS